MSDSPDQEKPEIKHLESTKQDISYVEETRGHHFDVHSGEGLRSKWEDVSTFTTVRLFWKAILFCFLASITSASDGYQIGINGNIIANKGFIEVFGNGIDPTTGEKILTASTLSAFSAMISVGQVIGMCSLPFLSDRWGRKPSMYGFLAILVLSVTFETAANNWQLWLVGKLFAGIGVGCLQITLPTYISEISPYKVRGAMIACQQLWWSLGSLFAPVALQVMSKTDPLNWKVPIYTQWGQLGLMAIIYIAILPESPWSCCNRGKHEQGRRLLAKINGGIPGYDVDEEYRILERTVQLEREAAVAAKNESFTAMFTGVNKWRTFAAGWSLVASQFLGLALIGTYTTYFFILAGQDDPFKTTIITSCVGLISVIVSILTVDHIGRYWTINAVMTIGWLSLLFIGIVYLIDNTSAARANALVALACIWSYCNTTNYTVSWAMMAEVPSSRLRAKTAGFAAACSAVAGVVFVVITPYLINVNNANWGLKTCFFFFGTGFPFVVGGWLIIPETKRRSPAELDELYEGGVRPWRFRNTVTQVQLKRASLENE